MSALHGGAHWQPLVCQAEDYAGIVAADVNDAWYPPAPGVLHQIAQWAPHSNHSPDTSCRSLREILAAQFELPHDAIRVGAGSSDLLHHAVLSLVGRRDTVLTLEPTYAEYARVAGIAGAQVDLFRLVPESGFAVDVGALASAAGKKTRLLVLCNPNNPTGAVVRCADLIRLLKRLPEETSVLVDEAYIDFVPSESALRAVLDFPNLGVIQTFSKAYAMAGLRLGYAALGERLRARFDARGRPPWPVSLVALRAGEAALKDRQYVIDRVQECGRLKTRLIEDLDALTIPSQTHYFLIDLQGTHVGAPELLARLRERNIFLRDFGTFSTVLSERFVRVTTQSEAGNARIASAVNEVLKSSARAVAPAGAHR